MAVSDLRASGGRVRRGVSGFSPRQPPEICRNIRNNHRLPMRTRARVLRIIRIGHATQAKRAGDTVAQHKFIRIAPATPKAMSLLESCGVADKTAISGGCPGAVNWTSYRAYCRPGSRHMHHSCASWLCTPPAMGALDHCRVQPLHLSSNNYTIQNQSSDLH